MKSDVAGELVRPLCRALGYTQGSETANLRSQISLQYDRAFLGHKDSKRDPVLRGRPDFVCEVVSYARWVVEAKKPSIELTLEDSQQAHTYATHPEIAAEFYLLTNGREFRLYRVGRPQVHVMQWLKDETDDMLPILENLLGPDAMKKRADVKVDLGKPLARGIGSRVKIVGGEVLNISNVATIPLTANLDGIRHAVVGDEVTRRDDGLITATVAVKSAFADVDAISKALGLYPLTFNTADEYISNDIEHPTLMQNVAKIQLHRGDSIPTTLISPGGVLPCDVSATCYTEALGFVSDNTFKGSFVVDYDMVLDLPRDLLPTKKLEMRTEGTFKIVFGQDSD